MTRAVLLTGGRGHPAEATVPSLRRIARTVGVDLDVFEDVDAALQALDDGHDLLLVNALRFTMTHPRYDEVRHEHAYELPASGASALLDWHRRGGPILALHTAVISFDSWPGWGDLLGGRWNWDRSFHPPIGPCTVRFGDRTVELVDEAYRDLDLDPSDDVHAWTVVDGEEQPVMWTRTPETGGSVGVDLLGHDARSLGHPEHAAALGRLLQSLLAERSDRPPETTP